MSSIKLGSTGGGSVILRPEATGADVNVVVPAAEGTLASATELASTVAGKGASLVRIADAGQYFSGTTVEEALQQIAAAGGAFGTTTAVDEFVGDGTTEEFELSILPVGPNLTDVYINGTYQNKSTYTLAGTTLTFSDAPPLNAKIEVLVNTNVTAGGLSAENVRYVSNSGGEQFTTVESKLRETVSVKDFGAVGDGVTDDTAAIQAALTSGAGRVYFPVGFYKHTGITISNAVTLVGASYSESAGSVLVCSAAGVDNITIPATGQVVVENLCIRGNNPSGTPSTNGSGIHINTQATPTLRNVFIFNNGEYGIKITDNASRLHVDTCRIQSNTLGGIWGKSVSTAQINAITINNCAISFNGPFGIDVWGNSVNIENNIIESHDVGVKVSYVDTASVSSIYAYAIKNNYFEAHSTNQILVETTVSQTIIGFEITGNYGYQNTSDVAYRHVKFTSASSNEVRSMIYGFNAFYSKIHLVNAVVADFGSRLASDCVIYPYFTYNTSALVLSAPFANYENLGSAKFEAFKSVTCIGVTESFGGSGIAYTTLEKSDNITVSGSKIFFAPDLPLGALPVSLTIGIETNATSYAVSAFIYSRPLGSTGAFSTVTASFTMPATSGSTTQTWIFNPLTAVRKTPTVFEYKMEIVVTLTTPGTTFYLGNPSITYIG